MLWTKGMLEPAVGELEAAARVPGVAPAVRAGASGLSAYLRLFLGQGGTGTAARARDEGERLGDDYSLCVALQALAVAAGADARVADAVQLAERAAATATRSSAAQVGVLHPHLTLGLVLLDADRFDEAEAALREGRRRAEERGSVAWLPLYHCVLALRRMLSGAWDDGLAEVGAGMALAEEVGTRLYVPFLHGMSAWVGIHRGELVTAQAHMEEAVREFLVSTTASWQAEASEGLEAAGARWPLEWGLWINALLNEARGDQAQALGDLENAWSAAAPLRYFLGYRLFGPDLVRIAAGAGNHALASAVTDEVAEGARRCGVASATAAALRCQGLLDDDAMALAAAADAFRSTPRAM
ncbi:MAG: hypothetical protein ACRD0D_08225, partial [Acidimicrobiales bacterium]